MKNFAIYILIAGCIFGCQSTTEITGSWKNPNVTADKNIGTIMVTALYPKTNVRKTVENDIANVLSKNGYRTIQSLEVMPPFTEGKTPDKDQLFSSISKTNADAIMTVTLIDKETETRYVPGNAAYAPVPRFGYYRTFWGYYNTWYPMMYSQGYYEEDKIYFIETNLYDARTEDLLWSAQSETYNPSSLDEFSKEFANIVVSKMEEDGLLIRNGDELAKERDK